MRFEFFISRVNVVFFIKKGVFFYKKSPLLIKIADFVNFSILEGKKRVILANVIDPMWKILVSLK